MKIPHSVLCGAMARALCLIALLALARTSSAEVSERLVYTSYLAQADSSRSLLRILNDASPYRGNGQAFHAYTKWYVSWQIRWFERPDGRCRITSVVTELSASIDLPRLAGANAMQAARFERYLSALRRHELGHYNFGKEAAQEIDGGIRAMPEMASCPALEAAANHLGDRTLNAYKARELQYDSSTGHGKTQGAWLGE